MAPVDMGVELDEYIFFARTVQASCIRQLCDVLEKLLKDVSLVVTPAGVKIGCMDSAQICLIHVMLKATEFQTFHCSKPMYLGCKLPEVAKLLKSATHNDTVTLYVAKNEVDVLGVRVDNKDTDFSAESGYKLMDLDYEECGFEDVAFAYVITMPSAQLQRICREQSALADYVTIISKDNELVFQVEGDASRQRLSIGQTLNGMSMQDNVHGKEVSAEYSLKYLLLFSKATALFPTVELFIAEDYPLIFRYACGTLGELKLALSSTVDDTNDDTH